MLYPSGNVSRVSKDGQVTRTTGRRSYVRKAPPSVEELLKDLLVDRGYRPGDKLPTELDFAAELQVSRNAVREALRSLQTLGVVEIRHGHGIYLSSVSLARISDGLSFWGRLLERDGEEVLGLIAEVRCALEVSLLPDAIERVTDTDIEEMTEAVQEIEKLAAQGKRALNADRRFHETLYRPLENWVLLGLLRAFWDSTAQIVDSVRPKLPVDEAAAHHLAILDAVKQRDTEKAVAAMKVHFGPFSRE